MVEVYEDRTARRSIECDCWLCKAQENGIEVCFCDSYNCQDCGSCSEHCRCAVCVVCDAEVTMDDEKCPNCGNLFVKGR